MSTNINTQTMRADCLAAAQCALSIAKEQRGIAATATTPEEHTGAITAAYRYIGAAIAFQETADRYEYMQTANRYETTIEMKDHSTKAHLRAEAAHTLGLKQEETEYKGAEEAYTELAELIRNGKWEA